MESDLSDSQERKQQKKHARIMQPYQQVNMMDTVYILTKYGVEVRNPGCQY